MCPATEVKNNQGRLLAAVMYDGAMPGGRYLRRTNAHRRESDVMMTMLEPHQRERFDAGGWIDEDSDQQPEHRAAI